MRELTMQELRYVAGAGDECPDGEESGNDIGGVKNSKKIGEDLINIYEGVVQAASHIIERVANSL